MCSCKIGTEGNGNEKSIFAVITAPKIVADEIIKLDGIEIHEQIITIQTIPLEFHEVNFQTVWEDNDEMVNESQILSFVYGDDLESNVYHNVLSLRRGN